MAAGTSTFLLLSSSFSEEELESLRLRENKSICDVSFFFFQSKIKGKNNQGKKQFEILYVSPVLRVLTLILLPCFCFVCLSFLFLFCFFSLKTTKIVPSQKEIP